MPFTLATPAHSDLTIRKSRFIGCVEPMAGRAEARARVVGPGPLRRELEAAGASGVAVAHGMRVELRFSLPDIEVDGFVRRVDDAAQGRIDWVREGEG